MTAPGLMRERLRFERREGTPDGFGNVTNAWVEQVTRAARVRPIRSRELEVAGAIKGVRTYEIVVRQEAATLALTSDMRAVDVRSGVIYALTGPPANLDQHDKYLTVPARVGAGD